MNKHFSFQPTLSEETVSLRPLHENDFESLFSCAADKKLWQDHPSKNRYKEVEFKKWFDSALNSMATVVFVDNVNQKIIGSSRFYTVDSSPDDISIGYTFLARQYWGGKTNLALKKLMLAYAFQYFDVVWFHIAPSNIRSQKAIEKIGGVFSHQKIANISKQPENWLFYKIEKVSW